jgi:hypothetical protein
MSETQKLPYQMRKPRNGKGGWFYINHASIDVVSGPKGNGIVTLTRRQLEAAFRVMDKP